MKKFIYFGFTLLFIGCNRGFVTGKYFTKGTPETLILKDDNTYYYSYFMDGSDLSKLSQGSWMLAGKKIILNSDFIENKYPLDVIEINNNETGLYYFLFDTIYTREKGNNIWQELLVNDSLHFSINNSLMKIPFAGELKNFKIINYYVNYFNSDNTFSSNDVKTLETIDYIIQNKKSNFFKLSYKPFNSSIFHYRFFDNDTFEVKRKGLFWKQQGRHLIYETKAL